MQLGIEYLSTFGMDPVEYIHLAADLGFEFASLNLSGSANRLPPYPEHPWRHDRAVQTAMKQAIADRDIAIGLVEGFGILPDTSVADHAAALDLVAEMGARSICAVSMDRDLARTHAEFAELTDMAAQRGLITTTEVCAGVMRNLERSLAAHAAVGNPSFRLLIDTMHFFRFGSSVEDMAALDPGVIGHVQLCDVPMPAVIDDYMQEALYERRAPGDGDLPLADFLNRLPAAIPVGLEVPIRSEFEAGISAHDRFARILAATRAMQG